MVSRHFGLAGTIARWTVVVTVALLVASQVPALSAQNLLTNPGFNTGLNGWEVFGLGSWDGTRDVVGSPVSGSAKGVFDSSTPGGFDAVVAQCVPLAIGLNYHLGGKIFIPPGATAESSALFQMIPFPTMNCSGPPPPGPIVETPQVTAVGSWTDSSTDFPNSFAQSGQVWASIGPITGGHFQANFDDVVLAPIVLACTPDAHTLCLLGSRFKVTATFAVGAGNPSSAWAVPIGNSGYFWFFSADNVELVVKMIDGCGLGNHFWFFAAGLTNVNVAITVTDLQTGAMKTYHNRQNVAFQPIQDTSAFPCP